GDDRLAFANLLVREGTALPEPGRGGHDDAAGAAPSHELPDVAKPAAAGPEVLAHRHEDRECGGGWAQSAKARHHLAPATDNRLGGGQLLEEKALHGDHHRAGSMRRATWRLCRPTSMQPLMPRARWPSPCLTWLRLVDLSPELKSS